MTTPPPRVLRRIRFRSPLRGPWLTSVLGVVLLACLPLVIVTGLLDYAAYGPGQGIPADVGWLRLPAFDWPTRPAWLFQLTQGLHVGLGLVLAPVVLAKLWSVIPKLFAWPPVRSLTHALERISLLFLVGSTLFEFATGILNIQYDYVFGFSFYTGHYIGAWVFLASFVTHVALKLPTTVRALRSRSLRRELATSREDTVPEPPDDTGLVATDPAPPTLSRRGLLGTVGGGALLVGLLTAGQSTGGPLRDLALLLPRGRQPGEGFPVNRTAAAAGITAESTGASWRLTVTGGHELVLTRDDLLALPQHTARLPIACVEGWSTVQTWTGVRLRDLATLAGIPDPASASVTSLERGPFAQATLDSGQATDPDSLLALRVNGEDLNPDHGFPARVIVPALPGVHCTKWVRSIAFRSAR
ncbi:molybdopterin-dependent oxidoreductase [Amycolatopsis thermoflava]|uniref:molybdopterin-dependent oxidoreductase n=1 Tax=Amycolatopsis thermoflava TaxID=84480 RepID=UPI001E505123|nr:molybdopterin-dependent oxidoreductase [Amycolatopsis thermoflava]